MKRNHKKIFMGAILAATMLAAPKVCFAEEGAANDITNVKKYEYNGHLYSVLDSEFKSLDEMKIYAENLGGHLVYINDAQEDNFVGDLIKMNGSKSSYAIGIKRDKESRQWKFYDGQVVSYTNWAKGEPNREDEDYVHKYKSNGQWNNTINIPKAPEGSIYRIQDIGMVVEWETAPLYKFFEQKYDHFYTTDITEITERSWNSHYKAEPALGVPVWYVLDKEVPGSVPLYRYYNYGNNAMNYDHYYSADINSPETKELESKGYKREGIQCYVYKTQVPGSVPVYQYVNVTKGNDHYYTIDKSDIEKGVSGDLSNEWRYEGIAYYAIPVGE